MEIKEGSVVRARKTAVTEDREGFLIGIKETGNYLLIEKKGEEILRELDGKKRVREIENKFPDIDVKDFIKTLLENGFIESIDGKRIMLDSRDRIRPLFSGLKRTGFLFHPASYAVYFFVIIFAAFLLAKNPSLIPKFDDFFFTDSFILLIIFSTAIGWSLIFLHEFAHYLAAVSRGIDAKFGITNRLYFLVAITDTSNAYSLRRKERYRIMFAGMVADLFIAGIAVIITYLSLIGKMGSSVAPVMKFIVLFQFFGIVWQFMFFLRTDLYYAIENFFKIFNLHEKAKEFIIRLGRISLEKRERPIVETYSVLFIAGIIINIWFFIKYSLPITIELFRNSITTFIQSIVSGIKIKFYDSVVFLLSFFINQSVMAYAVTKHHKLQNKPVFLWSALVFFIAGNYFFSFFLIIALMTFIKAKIVIYSLTFLLGTAFSLLMVNIIRRLNHLVKKKVVYEGILLASISVITAFVLFRLMSMVLFRLQFHFDPRYVTLSYVYGIILGLIYKVLRK